MKKSLFALAAVTAFAGAAQAQSSVTVYGILDVGYVGGNERGSAATVAKQTWNTLGESAQSTSRLGFRGREDLGGGTAAFFTVEMQVTPNSATSPLSNNRNAFVGLSQKGMGQAAIGLQNTLIADAMGPTLTSNFATVTGSVLFPGLNGGGNTVQGDGATSLTANTNNGNQSAFTFRTSNTLKVQTERMGGFIGSAMLVMNDRDSTQTANTATSRTGGTNNQNGWGLGGNFVFKNLTAVAAYQSFKAVNPYGQIAGRFNATTGLPETTTTAGNPAVFGAVGTGSNVSDNQAYVGAAYNFGILTAYAGWIDRKVTSQINANQFARRTAQEIGVRGNWTPKIQSYASVGNGRLDRFGAAAPTANFVGYQLGTNYILSKRTNLYAIYGYTGTSNASTTAAGVPVSYNASNYALGVRHTF